MTEKKISKKQLNKKGKDLFDRWNEKASIQEGDQFPVVLKKVGIRIGGILLFILFSPILFIIFVFVVAVSL
tara:strand:- start:95 stop:307 length:213 start_codon:yes stop_codon:yes gene_type:complete